jgi:2-iminobutanoate/2-iminopropanoate deaminase
MKKSIITSTTISNPYGLYPLGTRAGDLAFLSLQVPTNTETKRLVQGYNDLRVADLKRAKALATGLATSDSREGPAIAQVWQCYSQTADLLEEIGSSINNTLFTMLYLTDMRDYPEFTRSRRAFFAPDVPPASTSAMIGALPHPDAVFGFDGYAFIPDPNHPSHRMVALNESRHVKHLQLSDYGLGPVLN